MSSVFDQPWAGRHVMIAQRLRQRREELGLTQKQVVSRLGRVGVLTTNRALSSLEHGSGLDIAKLPELATVLDCTITYLLGLTDDPRNWQPDQSLRRMQPRPTEAAERSAPRRRSCILGDEIPERPRRFT